jgi:hypothetical protein
MVLIDRLNNHLKLMIEPFTLIEFTCAKSRIPRLFLLQKRIVGFKELISRIVSSVPIVD